MKKLLAIVAASALALSACSGGDTKSEGTTTQSANSGELTKIVVGASPAPHGDILNYVAENLAADAGLELEIVEYSDYVLPNKNLADGNLDANFFQHVPYLEDQISTEGFKFSHGEGIHIEPYGVYSNKLTSLDNFPEGGTISIVNDPSNQARALWLLQDEGLIKVADVESPTLYDITENPKNIQFQELEAPNLPRTLDDVDASVINGNFAISGGLTPSEDSIALESAEDNPYANILVWNTDTEKADAINKLDQLLHSKEVADFIGERWADGAVLPAFDAASAPSATDVK